MNKKGEQFLQQYPNAAKVYFSGPRERFSGLGATISQVNGEKPAFFFDRKKDGFFLLPGENLVDVTFQKSTHLLLFTRHTYSGNLQYNLVAEAGKCYFLRYNFKTEQITFEECMP